MLLHHPILAIRHLLDGKRKAPDFPAGAKPLHLTQSFCERLAENLPD